MRTYLPLICLLLALNLVACKSDVQSEVEVLEEQQATDSKLQFNPHKGPVQPICSAPAPIQDIWKLEPMLIDKGLITESMDKEQRETVIREYIKKKNSAYDQCLKGS
ncbi:hypothetical protein [Kangiella koreensis]|uniref:Lipoprotein n=1 Tax=Kangiella koreensis (strain DSM 16069 / JCM 12317 / KCTC 12182 / SW-125) TaxID=523791 RepID=C7R5Q1_KANKD|nr:hypothetical protein [Kangiella koreensis]ACV27225.1 conserved hypothetical protein [Kangiella koreensis DSM 16069]